MGIVLEGYTYFDVSSRMSVTVTEFSGEYYDTDLLLYASLGDSYNGSGSIASKYDALSHEWTSAGQQVLKYQTSLTPATEYVWLTSATFVSHGKTCDSSTLDNVAILKLKYTVTRGFAERCDWEPLTETLPTPTNLHATNITSTSAQLHWNSVENAVDYKVEYRVQGATDWTEDQQ